LYAGETMRKKVIEGEFAILWEDDNWWIVQDKVYSRFPVAKRSHTETFITIYIDFVEINGKYIPAYFYLPKNVIPLRIAMDHFNRVEETHKKRVRELELYRGFYEGESNENVPM